MHKLMKQFAFVAAVAAAGPAGAVVGWSRACPFADMPLILQVPATRFLSIISSLPYGAFDFLQMATRSEQYRWWVHESFTADYGRVQYYLFAQNKVYRQKPFTVTGDSFSGSKPYTVWRYVYETGYVSPGFVIETLPELVLTDPALKPLWANRGLGIFANARAGDPEIFKRWAPASSVDAFAVIGRHAYLDARTGISVEMGGSVATDCNFSQVGLEGWGMR